MHTPTTPTEMGWDAAWEDAWAALSREADWVRGRVVCDMGVACDVWTAEHGPLLSRPTGRFQHDHPSREDRPAVGDWVAVSRRADGGADLHDVLPRRTRFIRRAAGERLYGQVVAANIDTVFLVGALDASFNLRRLERFLAVAHASGAEPVIVLNKADLHRDPRSALRLVEGIAGGAPAVLVSAIAKRRRAKGRSVKFHAPAEALAKWVLPARTVAFLGPSGVGKSTLTNVLAREELLPTQETRDWDARGRHTTTRRELVITPEGGLVIDTPGMREMGFWGAGEMLAIVFPEIAEHAARCRFRDCRHESEPDCAVRAAVTAGAIATERFASFMRLRDDDVAESVRKPREFDPAGQRRFRALRERLRWEGDGEDLPR